MKYSIVHFKNLENHDDWRWDSEFLCFEPRNNERFVYKTIGEILKFSQYGISIDMNESGNGYKIYRMNEITGMFCDRSVNKYAEISVTELRKFKLIDGDVLFNRTNSQEFVGRTGLYKKYSDEDIVFASYLIRVRPNLDEILPEYLTTFLNTRYGERDAKRRARISINQSNINAEELKRIKIPILPMDFQEKIKSILNLAFTLINTSETLYSQAEQILLTELNLVNWVPKHKLSFVKNYSHAQSAERIDAEYFQPIYEEVVKVLQNYKNGCDLFGDLVNINDRNFTPRDDIVYKYIELSNISINGNIDGFMEELGKNLPTRARQIVKKGDVIISSIEGSLESIALINEPLNNALCSTGFYAVNSLRLNSETLLIFLKSQAGQLQLKKGCSGTILTAISKDELSKLVIPKIDQEKQLKIKKKIDEMYQTKDLSTALLDLAKRGVEIAIELDEVQAQNWIEKEMEKIGL